ncbi:hypothetical protein LJC19_05640 [Oxalobacter sp. OttesenSCG-928-P03]|nr:hypothetical protein [Oxalobacter sp. OttesenSCG-928-P03]
MQTPNTTPVTAIRAFNGYSTEVTSGAVTAVQDPKTTSPDSTTVKLSNEAIDRYASDQSEPAVKNEEEKTPLQQAGQEATEKAAGSSEGGSDPIAETLERLQELLKEAQERLRTAQQQMAQAMAEMRSAGDEAQKMAAMVKVQAAQALVISAQGEVLQIHTQINKILQEQQKQA